MLVGNYLWTTNSNAAWSSGTMHVQRSVLWTTNSNAAKSSGTMHAQRSICCAFLLTKKNLETMESYLIPALEQ